MLTAPKTLELNGKAHHVLCSVAGLARFKRLTGENAQAWTPADWQNNLTDPVFLPGMLWAFVAHSQPNLTPQQVEGWLESAADFKKAMEVVFNAYLSYMGLTDEEIGKLAEQASQDGEAVPMSAQIPSNSGPSADSIST